MVGQSAQTLYALRILNHHGLSCPPLWDVTRATLISRLLYASLVDGGTRSRLQSVLNKATYDFFLSVKHRWRIIVMTPTSDYFLSVLTYGTEAWAMKKANLHSLERTERDDGEMDVRKIAEG